MEGENEKNDVWNFKMFFQGTEEDAEHLLDALVSLSNIIPEITVVGFTKEDDDVQDQDS